MYNLFAQKLQPFLRTFTELSKVSYRMIPSEGRSEIMTLPSSHGKRYTEKLTDPNRRPSVESASRLQVGYGGMYHGTPATFGPIFY